MCFVYIVRQGHPHNIIAADSILKRVKHRRVSYDFDEVNPQWLVESIRTGFPDNIVVS